MTIPYIYKLRFGFYETLKFLSAVPPIQRGGPQNTKSKFFSMIIGNPESDNDFWESGIRQFEKTLI